MDACRQAVLKVLEAVGEDGVAQSDLVKLTGFSKSTVSYVVSRLEAEGMVVRRRLKGEVRAWLSRQAPREPGSLLRVGFIKALEYPFVIPLREKLKELGFTVDLKAYASGLRIVEDLVRGRLELAMAPFVTQLVYQALVGGLAFLITAARGGASLLVPKGLASLEELRGCRVFSTSMSSMESFALASLRLHGVEEREVTFSYASSPEELCRALEEGGCASLWEPYATMMERRGLWRAVDYLELLDEPICCVVSTSHRLAEDLEKVAKALVEAYDEFRGFKDSYLEAYASLLSYPTSLAKEAAKRLNFDHSLSFNEGYATLTKLGLRNLTPHLKKALTLPLP